MEDPGDSFEPSSVGVSKVRVCDLKATDVTRLAESHKRFGLIAKVYREARAKRVRVVSAELLLHKASRGHPSTRRGAALEGVLVGGSLWESRGVTVGIWGLVSLQVYERIRKWSWLGLLQTTRGHKQMGSRASDRPDREGHPLIVQHASSRSSIQDTVYMNGIVRDDK